jgi:mono/diheme cytochrome c family protein
MNVRSRMTTIAACALVLASCGGAARSSGTTTGPVGPGDPLAGAAVYTGTCAPCHGRDLQGIQGLGKQLAPNAYIAESTEEDITAFLIVGRPADDPANTQGIAMPPRGGNNSLTDQDLRDVAAYLGAHQ